MGRFLFGVLLRGSARRKPALYSRSQEQVDGNSGDASRAPHFWQCTRGTGLADHGSNMSTVWFRFVCFSWVGCSVACGARVDGDPSEARAPRIPATATVLEEPPLQSAPDAGGGAAGGGPSAGDAQARSACDACRGYWGVQGFNPMPSCNCRTLDFGQECRDGSECEGQCLSSSTSQVVTHGGPPRRGYYVGQCSEFVRSYGCHIALQNGINTGAPLDLDESPPTLCID